MLSSLVPPAAAQPPFAFGRKPFRTDSAFEVLWNTAQEPPAQPGSGAAHATLSIVVLEGEDAVNNIKQRTAREMMVRVEDENHRPVAGAAVTFLAPNQGASGTFIGGNHIVTVTTDNLGRASASGFKPNNIVGKYQVNVTATFAGTVATTVIAQTNALLAAGAVTGAAAGAAAAGHGLLIAVVVGVAAAAAAGAGIALSHGSKSSTPATGSTVTIGLGGTPTVGAGH